ncbi:hypothetical protein FGSG_13077 [Fusarium graminearum PH-1]|uniref:Chromosome 4, complete genome n=1 Tax=Gibberella zeae (strain ATCC MYA-4620 / CBS 123657 / FGSC 9075 / NRRL 31084 / PH-1) TaxID=229533 RepID=I1S899_GIBZE|nr:hypothetical protein FGSG_13077 [Fusarium graminearum PH-1]ESU13360.1 hypothetical protein FGSG_13077 [Fusarium graminearum PH-1]CEF83151.1 unnamed protein product [Fusarium graminearum]|eukprot:XP_011326867.1 hypothetical protein FGSG_13077 [Fusarium graminearum PH-1]
MTSVFHHSFCHFTSPAIGRDQLSAPLRVKSALYRFYSQYVYMKGKEMQALIGVPPLCDACHRDLSPRGPYSRSNTSAISLNPDSFIRFLFSGATTASLGGC